MAKITWKQRLDNYCTAQNFAVEKGLSNNLDIADIVVTTPIKYKDVAAQEAKDCLACGGGFYFKTFFFKPKRLELGSRVYYIDDGAIRGFGILSYEYTGRLQCETSGNVWGDNESYNAIIPAHTWHWVKPVVMRGFQGFRYMKQARDTVEIIGDWQKPKPQIN
jgi:hypothetical protein